MTDMQAINVVQALRIKYPDRVPVHVTSKLEMSKTKFLVPSSMSLAEFQYNIRRLANIKLSPSEGLYILVGNEKKQVMASTSSTFALLDREWGSPESVLHLYLRKENMFGC